MFKKQYQEYQQHITAPEDFTERLMEKRKRKKAVPIALVAPLCLLLILYMARSGIGAPRFARDEGVKPEDNMMESAMEIAPEEAPPEAAEEGHIETDTAKVMKVGRMDLPEAIIPPEGYLVEEGEGWTLYTDKGTLEFTLTSEPTTGSSADLEYFYSIHGVTIRICPGNEEVLEILYQAPYFQKEE